MFTTIILASLKPVIIAATVASPHAITIAPGDTLSGLAAQYGTTVSALASANGIADPNLIYAGSRLVITGGQAATYAADGDSDSDAQSASADPPAAPTRTYQPAPASAPMASSASYPGGSFGACVRQRENGNSYAWGTGDGGGAYQFVPSTWAQYAPPGAVYGQASAAQQDQAFSNAVAAGNTGAWSKYDGC